MTYLNPKDLNTHLVPGQPIGDAKTFETRGVRIQVNPDGTPKVAFEKGDVIYVDDNGYAAPFTKPSVDYKDIARPVPYGVVYLVDVKTNPKDLTPHSNEVKVVVNGVVPVKMLNDSDLQDADKQTKPHVGQMVNPYGGAMRVVASGFALQPLGICDGIEEHGGQTYVSVRLTPGSGSHSNELHTPRFVKCVNRSLDAIEKYTPVYLTGVQPTEQAGAPPYVKALDDTSGASLENIFGFAWPDGAAAEPEVVFPVLYFGVAYFPYVLKSNPAVAKLAAENGGKVPRRFPAHLTRPDGTRLTIFIEIFQAIPAIASLVTAGIGLFRAIKDSNSAGKVTDVVEKDDAKYHELLRAEGNGFFDTEPDGYLGVFVNPGVNGPVPVTGKAVLLEPERDKNGNLLIREGKCYVGSAEGVRPYDETKGDTPDSVSFYGVASEPLVEDEETDPSLGEPFDSPRVRCVMEGLANLRPNAIIGPIYDPWKWRIGDFITIDGKPIPPADVEFVPHIGKAMEDIEFSANDGEEKAGLIDIRPFNPNQYVSVEHCKIVTDTPTDPIPLHASVYVELVSDSDVDYAKSNIGLAEVTADHLYTGVTGVLVRYDVDAYPEAGEYSGRAVIQISGYVRCILDPTQLLTAGMLIQYMVHVPGEEFGQAVPLDYSDRETPAFVNILGTLLRTDAAADGSDPHWYVVLAPRTQYVAPIEDSKKV